MTHTVFSETAVVLQSLFLGLLLGLLFEGFRFLRAITPTCTLLVFFEDAAYWILFSVISLLFFKRTASGEFLLFPAVAVFLGFLIFILTLGRVFLRLRVRFIAPLKRRFARRIKKSKSRKDPQNRKSLNIFHKIKRKIIFFKKSSSQKPKNSIK